MSRPLVVSFLLLATIANAAVFTKYSCGYTTSCDDCVENKDTNTDIETHQLGMCIPKVISLQDKTVPVTYECSADGTVQEVEYYDDKCKIQMRGPTTAQKYQCGTVKNSQPASLKLTKEGGTTGTTFSLNYCEGTTSCTSTSCSTFGITSVSGGCTNIEGYSYKAKQLATGNDVLFISGYTGTGCQPKNLLFQGEFVADETCNTLSQMYTYKCDAPTHYTTKTCGWVESCSACSEATETGKTLYDKCVNGSSLLSNASLKNTCSDGKVTSTTFTDDKCTEQKGFITTESCVYDNTIKYAKLTDNALYICSNRVACDEASSSSYSCTEYKPSSLVTTGKCVYAKSRSYIDGSFSYKATENGNSYRIAVFGDNKCQKDLKIQGDFTPGKCVEVRTATKTVCGTFAATTMLAASVIVAAMSLLLF